MKWYTPEREIAHRYAFGPRAALRLWRWYYEATEAHDRTLPGFFTESCYGGRPYWRVFPWHNGASFKFARECRERVMLAAGRLGISRQELEKGRKDAREELG